jgi:hypothetical protein
MRNTDTFASKVFKDDASD